MFKKHLVLLIPLIFSLLVSIDTAESLVFKNGMCPSGWSFSGNYCVGGSSAKGLMMKVGMCPSGWNSSGNYCKKN